jgi:hypothetical protein
MSQHGLGRETVSGRATGRPRGGPSSSECF